MRCYNCGYETDEGVEKCPNCGVEMTPENTSSNTSVLAHIIAFLIPIVGIFYFLFTHHDDYDRAKSVLSTTVVGVVIWAIVSIILAIVVK